MPSSCPQLNDNTPDALFKLAESFGDDQPFLASLLYSSFNFFDLPNLLGLPLDTVDELVELVQCSYLENRYHNELHAADVLFKVVSMVYHDKRLQGLPPVLVFAVLLSAAGHDSGHTGE